MTLPPTAASTTDPATAATTSTALPPLVVPSLRPELLGAPFPGTELPALSTAVAEAERWIDAAEVPEASGSSWTAWPDRPDFVPQYGPISLNTGAAGIAWFSLLAADLTGDTHHLDRARRAGDYLAASWPEHIEDAPLPLPGVGLGFYGGLAGVGAVLAELARRDDRFRGPAIRLATEIVNRAGATGGRGFGWTGSNALMGDGGIVISLLDIADRLVEPRLREPATAVAAGILAEERPQAHGASWPGVAPEALGMPPGTPEMEGLELGTVGIGFLFAKLALATGDRHWSEAAVRAGGYIAGKALVVGDAALLERGPGQYSFGYCTGSSGVIRSFVAIHRATGDRQWLDWALRFGRGILRSGVPVRSTPGNTWVLHQCCGTAGIVEALLGLWGATDDRFWLDAAAAVGDDLLIRSVLDERGRRWYSENFRLPVGTLKAEVGHQVGASGVAEALLRLDAAGRHSGPAVDFGTIRLPDDPFGATG